MKIKKLSALTVVFFCLLALFGCSTAKVEYTTGLKYFLSNDKSHYTVIGIGTADDTHIIIPDTYRGKPVTTIRQKAFAECDKITAVTIPDSVTSIGKGAFSMCTGLEAIVIPKNVTVIEGHTFEYCTNLKSIYIPIGITRIGSLLFRDCIYLTEITFGGTVAQWQGINKNSDWNWNSAVERINCSDGVVETA